MIEFFWHRRTWRHGVKWELSSKHSPFYLGTMLYLPGSKRWEINASAPVKDGVVLCSYLAGTATAARRGLEADWRKRSAEWFGTNELIFHEDRR